MPTWEKGVYATYIHRISEGADAASKQTDSTGATVSQLVELSELLKDEMGRFRIA